MSPGSKHIGKSAKNAADELDAERCSGYRTMAPTAHYVAADRPDVQYTTAVLMRTLETPLVLQEMQLQRLASYWNAVLELRWDFAYQEWPTSVYVEVDSDWAQCPRTRRSTGGGLIIFGRHLLDSYCQQQQTVALSSAEAELHEIVTGAARGLFVRNVLRTMGTEVKVTVGSDSSAAGGISQRLGAGRVRHLEAKDLWIQEKVRSHELKVVKVGTEKNRADLLTKFLDPSRHAELIALLPLSVPGTRRSMGHTAARAAMSCVLLAQVAAGRGGIEDDADGDEEDSSWYWGWTWFLVACAMAWRSWRQRPAAVQTRHAGTQTDAPSRRYGRTQRERPAGSEDRGGDALPASIFCSPAGECYHRSRDCRGLRRVQAGTLMEKRLCIFCSRG